VIIGQPFIPIVRGLGELKEPVILTTVQMFILITGTVVVYPYGLNAVAWCVVSVYALGFLVSMLILAVKLSTSVWELLTPMRAGLVYTTVLALLWSVLEFSAGLSTNSFLGSGVFVALAGGVFLDCFSGYRHGFLVMI